MRSILRTTSFPHARRDLTRIDQLLDLRIPFVFVRFSDGEMEILRNEPLHISETDVIWRKGHFPSGYPVYDSKTFVPERDTKFRADLVQSAEHQSDSYFKGVPSTHNRARDDRNLMIQMNGGSTINLTFADLMLNSNYLKFLSHTVPLFQTFAQVYVVGNFRMQPKLMNEQWELIPIQDNFFPNYQDVVEKSIESILRVSKNALVLSSASSLSNILGMRVNREREDITFLDIGTTLHGQMGLASNSRGYHLDTLPWKRDTFYRKFRYRTSGSYYIRW